MFVAALVTEPAGDAPYPYIVKEEVLDLLEPWRFPRKLGGDVFVGDCNESDLRLRHSISKMGGDIDESFAVESDPPLTDSALVDDTSERSSFP